MTQAHFFNFCGFLVQSVPCMLLCLRPFPPESFSIRRKYMVSFFGSLLLAAAAVFSFFAFLPANQHGKDGLPLSLEFYANLFMAATLILCILLMFRVIRESLWKKLLVLCLVIDYAVFLYSGVNIALLLFPFPPIVKTGVYSDLSFSLYLILTLLTFPLLRRFMRRRLSSYLERIEPARLRHSLLIVVLLTALYAAVLFCLFLIDDSTEQRIAGYLTASLLFCSACLTISIWLLFWEIQKTEEEAQYKNLLSIQQLQYRKFTDELDSFHRTQHDMRHHFRAIDSLLREGKNEEAAGYISECVSIIDSREQEIFCPDPLINALLQYYVGEARQSGIRCEIHVRIGRCPIDSVDMTVLLGNCLENAVLSCLRSEEPRLIRLNMRIVNSTLAILMENTCSAVSFSRSVYQRENENGGYLPAKAFLSMGAGGKGLESLEHSAARYGGTAEFRFRNPRFYTRITLELPPSSPDSGTGAQPVPLSASREA